MALSGLVLLHCIAYCRADSQMPTSSPPLKRSPLLAVPDPASPLRPVKPSAFPTMAMAYVPLPCILLTHATPPVPCGHPTRMSTNLSGAQSDRIRPHRPLLHLHYQPLDKPLFILIHRRQPLLCQPHQHHPNPAWAIRKRCPGSVRRKPLFARANNERRGDLLYRRCL